MAAQISVADWALLTGRVDAAEQGLRSEQEQRGQLIEQLRAEFSATQVSWAAHSARLEELREQLTALRATLPGGAAGPAGAALLDPRLMDRPKPFAGDAKLWRDWSDSFQGFVRVADPKIHTAMETAKEWKTPQLLAEMEEPMRNASIALYHILTSLLREEAAARRRSCSDPMNGLEVWHRLVCEYQPNLGNRFMALYLELQSFQWDGKSLHLLEAWLARITEYENQSGRKFDDYLKMAVVANRMKQCELRTHLRLHVQTYKDWDTMLNQIRSYLQNSRTWPSHGDPNQGVMDVDALGKSGPATIRLAGLLALA